MALDEHKKPIICTHQDYEKVEGNEHYAYACKDCDLKFKYEPQQISRTTGRKPRTRRR